MKIEDFEEMFGSPSSRFTKAQWREIALSFLENKKPGRPKSASHLNSETVNVQALANKVKQIMDKNPELKIKATLAKVLRTHIKKDLKKKRVESKEAVGVWVPVSDLRLNGLVETYIDRTYKRVREHLAAWEKGK